MRRPCSWIGILAGIALMAGSVAAPLAAVLQQRACEKMGMHHDGRTPCVCGQMAEYGQAALDAVALPHLGPVGLTVVAADNRSGSWSPASIPDSPEFPPTPPPPNESA